MEKLGVTKDIQHVGLRNREADLMQKIQSYMNDGEKVGEDISAIQAELQEVRQKLTELDQADAKKS